VNSAPEIVVTGAGGFVGGYLARWFAEHGAAVTATLRRSRPLSALPAGVNVITGDVRQPGLLPERFDALIHCAAGTPSSCPDPDELRAINVEAARVLFDRSRDAGARTVVFLSSMSVYGQISAPVVTESLTPVNPDSYGRSKTDGEVLLQDAVAGGVASGLAIRLPGTVGRGSHHNFLSDTLGRARRGETIVARHPDALFNNIVFVGDLARFLAAWIGAPRHGYAVTNLAASEPMLFRDLYSHLFACLGAPERIQYETSGKPPFLISIDRARALGYHAPTVRESIASFVGDCIAGDVVHAAP